MNCHRLILMLKLMKRPYFLFSRSSLDFVAPSQEDVPDTPLIVPSSPTAAEGQHGELVFHRQLMARVQWTQLTFFCVDRPRRADGHFALPGGAGGEGGGDSKPQATPLSLYPCIPEFPWFCSGWNAECTFAAWLLSRMHLFISELYNSYFLVFSPGRNIWKLLRFKQSSCWSFFFAFVWATFSQVYLHLDDFFYPTA